MRNALFPAITSALIALGLPGSVAAQDTTDQQLGRVNFQTSCNDVAQRRFDRAMRYQHSFWYRQSQEIFEEALKADPGCAIALWGVALSLWNNPHNPPPVQNNAPALAALQKAKAIGAKTQRERDYIDALAVVYTDHDKTPYRPRLLAHVKAMEALAQRYPQDDEAQIAYAILLNVSAPLTDKTYAQQLKGAAILEPIAQRQPQHPGVVHYLIHLYDYPELAQKGLAAANLYAKVAPAAPHAQHMPSHIYTRVGYWKESIASNAASIRAAAADKDGTGWIHGSDYMVYAHLQLGQDNEARAVIDEMKQTSRSAADISGSAFGLAASPARYAIERRDWASAAQLEVRPSRFHYATAVTHFARALGSARSSDPAAARAEIAKLVDLRDKLRSANETYWAEQVDIQAQIATAWALYAEAKYDEALDAMKAAADAEDKTEKHVVTPGPLAPARELYGQMLLDRGMAREALAAFQATQQKEPNRYHGYAGAALAAERLGDKTIARSNYQKLIALAGGNISLASEGAAPRPELVAARKFLADN
jgi:tetratricopeptide (TPR) repeat protein